ncbi:hypothetical protein [Dorea longicatena]|jgi:hypothetical protein|uniref:hypothetical protein n=1 Tax=Dorea longicatena TaxID=88431 RepID=UPI001105F21B|nr:hypothetical protein [Dorea longicatena]
MAQKSFEWNANEQITLEDVQFARYLYELGSLRKIHCLYAGREDVLDYLKGKLDTMPQEEIE